MTNNVHYVCMPNLRNEINKQQDEIVMPKSGYTLVTPEQVEVNECLFFFFNLMGKEQPTYPEIANFPLPKGYKFRRDTVNRTLICNKSRHDPEICANFHE